MSRNKTALLEEQYTSVVITVEAPPSSSGVQIGYAVDHAEPTLLPTVFNEKKAVTIPVPTDAHENTTQRWSFFYSQNVKGAEQKCYTGASAMQEDILIEATAAPAK